MKKFLLTLFILFISASIGFCATTNSYDKYGNRTGSFKSNSSGTVSSYDRYGNRTGSYRTNSSGTTTSYDRYGNRTGSYRTNSNGVTTNGFSGKCLPFPVTRKASLSCADNVTA